MGLTIYSRKETQYGCSRKEHSSLQISDYTKYHYEKSWIERKYSKEFRDIKKPKVDHFKTESEKHEAAKSLFFEKLPGLLKEYEGKYAVAINGNILIGDDEQELYERAIREHGYTSMYLNRITNKSANTLKIRARYNVR